MKVIIPVAGEGTRLRPHTHTFPKPLLKVAGKEILGHILDPIVRLSPDEVIFVVGFKGEMIEQFVRQTYDFPARFVTQDKLLGLGYALDLALETIDGGPVLIVLGDTIVDCDLAGFVAAGDNVLGLRQVDDPQRFGIAEVADGRIIHLEEKPEHPKTNLAVIGLYYFAEGNTLKEHLAAHIASGRTTRGEIQFTDALERMIRAGEVIVPFEVQGWYDCGKKETMLETNRHLLARLPAPPPQDGCVIVPPVSLADSVTCEHAVIGPHVSVAGNVVIRRAVISDAIIGENTTITDAIITNSIVGRDAVIRGRALALNLGDSSEITFERPESD
ncbi:MAG: nucleotidyl transferase [Candidatus Zixiibacteriota bacterium]|nr:MAG: nucleotidyl transferase [candidate division Zixibacteria bacterium]